MIERMIHRLNSPFSEISVFFSEISGNYKIRETAWIVLSKKKQNSGSRRFHRNSAEGADGISQSLRSAGPELQRLLT